MSDVTTRAWRTRAASVSLVAALAAGGVVLTVVPAAATSPRVARSCAQAVKAGQFTCYAEKRTDLVPQLASPNVTPQGYGPLDLQSAYRFPSATAGTGQTVAIVDAFDDPQAESDLAAYRTQFGLTSCTTANGCFRKVNQAGQSAPLPTADTGWSGEISLDLDMVSAACPRCSILLVEADGADDNLFTALNTAVALGAKFVSLSWGGPENGSESYYDSHYLDHPGVVITAATGDNGYAAGVIYPATSPYAAAVGGTTLVRSNSTRGWSETAWSGAGSGCSSDEAAPAFQNGTVSCATRGTADVSVDADPNTGMAVYQTYGGNGWSVYGGTSAAAPVIAAAYALAGTPGATDNPATYPYLHAAGLNDVTSGNTGTCSPAPLCTAGPGWDGPTGLGSPNGTAAFTAANTVTLTNPGNQSTPVDTPAELQLHASSSGTNTSLSYAAEGLPTGLSLNSATGLISGTPTTTGAYTVSATSTDTTTATSGTTFNWTINAASTTASGPVAGAFGGLAPVRLLDTRSGVGALKKAVGPGAAVRLQVMGRGGVPASGVGAVVLNVTVTQPSSSGVITVWADGAVRPLASNLNYVRGETVPNLVIAPVGADGKVDLYNNSAGSVQLVADVNGYYLS